MSKPAFERLFQPIQIGPIEVRNRLYNPGHGKAMAENGMPGDQHFHYWVERAKGGVGLIITEVESVHPTSRDPYFGGTVIHNFDDSIIPYYQRISTGVHEFGAKIFAQLWHGGAVSSRAVPSVKQLWAASAIPIGLGEIPKEMEIEDIREIVTAFGDAADRAKRGGYDGVELHAAYTWLIHNFLSPATNQRTDNYGGSLENRMRFLRDIVDEVRGRVGDSIALGIRMNGDEFRRPGRDRRAVATAAMMDQHSSGLELPEVQEICRLLAADGQIDFIDTTVGGSTRLYMTVPPMAVSPGYQLHVARAIKEAVGGQIPVFAVGRLTTAVQAEEILSDGTADMVGMVRELIADPEFPNKARESRLDDIRPCVAANSCIGHVGSYFVSCIHNPATGREREWGAGTLTPASPPSRVLIIGGGPAGLEAARIAALRKHDVTLIERAKDLGGQVLLASRAPHREDLRGITDYLVHQLEKLGVNLILDTEATLDAVLAEEPDIAIVATGSQANASVLGQECFSAGDVLSGGLELGPHILVVDENGHHEAAGTVEYLAERGHKVTVVTSDEMFATRTMPTLDRPLLLERLKKLDVTIHCNCTLTELNGDVAHAQDSMNDQQITIPKLDGVVSIGTKKANDSLYFDLKGKVEKLYRIGDCVAPRLIDQAIYEGHSVGRTV